MWKYNYCKFEYEELFNDLAWPWAGHKYFAYDLIVNKKPKRIVELGTHYGTSLWSFSQAVKDNDIDCELNAIDTWQGESHAGFYGEEVFDTVKKIKDIYYSKLKINLIRKTFDEALDDFEDGSVDILHIDGLHTYDAVRHDFDTWFPKVKKDGIILLHDIVVKKGDFGVNQLWNELKKSFKTMEFHYSYGLGVLFLDTEKNLIKKIEDIELEYAYIVENREHEKINYINAKVDNFSSIIMLKNLEIDKMKSSKFWKLRDLYLKIKNYK